MPFVAQIGEAFQTLVEKRVEWEIHDFFSLSDKVEDYYDSPVFSFAGSRWHFRLYPNGDTSDSLPGWVSLYICREDKHPLKTIIYTFGIKCSDGVEEIAEEEEDFSTEYDEWGVDFWSRAKLLSQPSKYMPDNVLTITCRLKCNELNSAKVSLGNRVWEVSRNMKTVLADGKRADFTLKLGDREWPVHKVILETRSEYFANMFRHKWVENTVGEVTFEDIEADALDNVLNFTYCGDVEDMSVQNVCDIYVAAHKFLLDDLKALCIEFMMENMCMELVCKVLVIADTYGERDLNQSAVDYFNQEADQIFDSDEWKELKKNHLSIAAELLEENTKRERKKRKKERD